MVAGLTVLVAAAAVLALYLAVTGSLPELDGEVRIAGLSAPVTVARDAHGVPTIRGRSRADVARATGFVHAQDRFFQMDLIRRSTAGELAALVGPVAVEADKRRRLHRLRAVAREVVAGATERALLEAYAEGVNAGLEALTVAPFEYLVLRAEPAPWRPEDTVLGNLAMFFQLTDYDASRESGYAALVDGLPDEIGRFLFAPGNGWDAPLTGEAWTSPKFPIRGRAIFAAQHLRVTRPAQPRQSNSMNRRSAATPGPLPGTAPPPAGPWSPTTCTWG